MGYIVTCVNRNRIDHCPDVGYQCDKKDDNRIISIVEFHDAPCQYRICQYKDDAIHGKIVVETPNAVDKKILKTFDPLIQDVLIVIYHMRPPFIPNDFEMINALGLEGRRP